MAPIPCLPGLCSSFGVPHRQATPPALPHGLFGDQLGGCETWGSERSCSRPSHTARGCGLGTLQNVPPCPPTHFPLLRSGPDLLEATIPKGKHSVLGWRPRPRLGRLVASGQNMNLAGGEVSILASRVGPGSTGWGLDPWGDPQGLSQRGWRCLGTQCVLSSPRPPLCDWELHKHHPAECVWSHGERLHDLFPHL